MGHRCMVNELQRFPVLRKRMDDVIGNFLSDGLQPSETMSGHIAEMEVRIIIYIFYFYRDMAENIAFLGRWIT